MTVYVGEVLFLFFIFQNLYGEYSDSDPLNWGYWGSEE